MTYLGFHLLFNVPLLVLLGWLVRRRITREHFKWIGVVLLIVVLFAIPWDGWAIHRGFWSFGPDKVLFRLGVIPVEECLFFIFITLEACLLTILFLPSPAARRP